MKTIATFLAADSAWVRFHILTLSLFLTGGLMAITAQEFGAVAAFVVLGGIYAMLFAATAEALCLIRNTLRYLANRYLLAHQR